jgi:excisionase family DNA binding protein
MMTVKESAEALNLSPKRVYKLISDGRIAARERFGLIVISETEIKRFKKLPRSGGRPRLSSNGHTRNPRPEPRVFCGQCGASITETDRAAGFCTQCKVKL